MKIEYKTSMPGFTARFSLGDRFEHYSARVGSAAGHGEVQAQLRWERGHFGDYDCIPGCICFSQVNCPCCANIFDFPLPSTSRAFSAL